VISFLLDNGTKLKYLLRKSEKGKDMTVIKVCLGSSCYVRGNDKMLTFIEDYIQKNQKDVSLELVGCRCTNLCQDGPNIFIEDKKYSNISKDELIKVLEAL